MSVTLYLGLRLSGVAYKRISYTLNDDAFSTFTVENLKKVIAGELLENYSKDAVAGLELIYCGSVLDDLAELKKEGIKAGSTIHVFEKSHISEPEPIVPTSDSIKSAIAKYRKISSYCPGNTFPKEFRPETLSSILAKYPELYNNPGALAIIKDPVLLSRMTRSDQSQMMAEQYPILAYAAKFIAETIIAELKTRRTSLQLGTGTAGASDVETSELDSSQESVENDQRVTRSQLAAALFSASGGTVNNNQRYVAELATMREMGFTDDNYNLQALIACNGDVEAAVSLVMNAGDFS